MNKYTMLTHKEAKELIANLKTNAPLEPIKKLIREINDMTANKKVKKAIQRLKAIMEGKDNNRLKNGE